VIRFSAALVVAAIGVLIGGAVTSSLLLVYVAIGISALALVVLAVGVALKREELFGDEARSATSGTPERAGQSAGLPETQQELPSPAEDSPVQLASAAGARGSAFSRSAPAPSWGTDQPSEASRFPGRPGAWPPAEPGFPPAPAAGSDQSTPKPSRSRRPAAPPTRADPVLPWADAMPTRVDFAKGNSPDLMPSWLDDAEDDRSAGAARPSGAATSVVADPVPDAAANVPGSAAGNEADRAGEGAGSADAGAGYARSGDADHVEAWSAEDSPDADAAAAEDAAEDSAAEDSAAADDVVADAGDATAAPSQTPSGEDAGTSAGVPDPADLTDQAIELPDPEPDALSPVDAGSGDDPVPADADPDGPGDDDDETGVGRRLSGTEQVAVVPGVPRYHVEDCILIRFMDDEDVQRMTAEEAEKAGCTPCSACQPED
jgi:hypothetical protein